MAPSLLLAPSLIGALSSNALVLRKFLGTPLQIATKLERAHSSNSVLRLVSGCLLLCPVERRPVSAASPPSHVWPSSASIVGNEALSWSQVGPEDFILLNKYMIQGLRCSSYMIKLHSEMHSSMNPRNDVMNHGYIIWSVAILRPDFILWDRDWKWKIQHCLHLSVPDEDG